MPLELPPADDRVSGRPTVSTVICQIRFEEQPSVSEGALAIEFHERVGGPSGRYSKIEPAEGANRILFEMGPDGPLQQQTTRRTGWSLQAENGSWSLVLLPDNITLQAEGEGYVGWDSFVERLTEALEALADVVSPAVEQRVGLRFVDRIPGGDLGVVDPTGWEQYIAPEFLGPITVPGIGRAVRGGQQQLLLDAGNGATCGLRQGLAAITGDDRSVYVIDCDFYREGVRQFDPTAILEVVGGFREQSDCVFGVAATPDLLDALSK
jgi:uncharacterized protein (TIGR04255 family)